MKKYTIAYDPETDLWAIIDPEGFTKRGYWHLKCFEKAREELRNETKSPSSAPTTR